MNIGTLDSNVAKEVLTILLYSDKNIQEAIPDNIYKELTDKAADSSLDIKLYNDKKLNEQDLSNDALDMFALLYYTYVAKEEDKFEIVKNWRLNDIND